MPHQQQTAVAAVSCKMDESIDIETVEKDCKLQGAAEQTVVFLDYDDTLLASSFLSGKGYRLDRDLPEDNEVDSELRELEASVNAVLTHALSLGHVHIVTNAETGWVQLSAQKFMPAIVPLLNKVKIISARSTYECMHPSAPLKWKYCAFQQALANVFGGLDAKTPKHVLSFGDSHVEREAVRAVTRGVPNVRTKSVKFAERPSVEQLKRQQELVANCLSYIATHDGDLDLQLTVTVTPAKEPETPVTPTACGGSSAFQPQAQAVAVC